MSNSQFDFEQAKAKHLLFKSKLRAILYGENINEEPVLSQYECNVGKWIYDYALKAYDTIPEMQELEKVHTDIHLTARELVKLYKEGKVEESRKGLTKMDAISDRLVGLLTVIQSKVETEQSKINSYQTDAVTSKELQDLIKTNDKLDKKIRAESGVLVNERQLLHDFFMQAPAIFAILKGPDHVFEFANPGYIELIGNRNPVGKTVLEAVPEIKGQGFIELLDKVYKTGEPFLAKEMPATVVRNGKPDDIYVDFNFTAFKNADGQIEGILAFVYEVTEKVNARKIIEENNKKSLFIREAMPQKVWTADAQGNVDYFNQHWFDYTGKTFDELKEWGWTEIIHPHDLEENIRLWKHSIESGTSIQFEHRFKRHDGEYRWHLSRGIPKKDEKGNVLMWVGTNTDIHDLKMAQNKLVEINQDLETKVKFRNIELEREVKELTRKIEELSKNK